MTNFFFYVCNSNSTFYHVVASVQFNQSIYYVDESDGKAQAVLVLSNPSSSVVTVEIIANSITAMGKQINDLSSKELRIKFFQMILIIILVHTMLNFLLDQLLLHLASC